MAEQTQRLENQRITVNVFLASPGVAPFSFQDSLFITAVDSTLGGADVVTLTGNLVDDAQALVDAGNLSANAFKAVQAYAAQKPAINQLLLGNLQAGDLASYATAFARIRAVNDNFYSVALESVVEADIEAVSNAVESLDKVYGFVGVAADWLTPGLPAALTALNTRENTIGVYHDSGTEFPVQGLFGRILSQNPDEISAPWDTPIDGIATYSAILTSTQVTDAQANNINLMLPYGSEPTMIDPGVNFKGRPFYEILTKHWLSIRLRERIADVKTNASRNFTKITLDEEGQSLIKAEGDALLQQGLQASHFREPDLDANEPPLEFVAEPISAQDITLRRLRFRATALIAVSAINFEFNVFLTRQI